MKIKPTRQVRITIEEAEFATIDALDRLMRDHNLIAQQMGNEIMRKKMEIAVKHDPKLMHEWEKGFVDIGIDWKTKELVISPTIDPQKKAEEAADAIKNLKKN